MTYKPKMETILTYQAPIEASSQESQNILQAQSQTLYDPVKHEWKIK